MNLFSPNQGVATSPPARKNVCKRNHTHPLKPRYRQKQTTAVMYNTRGTLVEGRVQPSLPPFPFPACALRRRQEIEANITAPPLACSRPIDVNTLYWGQRHKATRKCMPRRRGSLCALFPSKYSVLTSMGREHTPPENGGRWSSGKGGERLDPPSPSFGALRALLHRTDYGVGYQTQQRGGSTPQATTTTYIAKGISFGRFILTYIQRPAVQGTANIQFWPVI